MVDLYLTWNADLTVDASGDILTVDNREEVSQRIVRRLLTNPGDYVWNQSYGGGLACAIGQPAGMAQIEATVRQQLQMEASVAMVPAPAVTVSLIDPARGAFEMNISYADRSSGLTTALSIPPAG